MCLQHVCASPNAHLPDLFENPLLGKQKIWLVPAEASSNKINLFGVRGFNSELCFIHVVIAHCTSELICVLSASHMLNEGC